MPPSPCGLTIHLKPGWAGCISARLDASIGAPGPHDFAVRDRHARGLAGPSCRPASSGKGGLQRRSSARRPIAHGKSRPAIPLRARRCRVHRIPPRVRDVSRSAPHPGGTGRACNGDLPELLSGIFLLMGLDRILLICPSGCFSSPLVRQGRWPLSYVAFAVVAISASCTNRTSRTGLMMSVVGGRLEVAGRDLKRRF